MRKGPQNRPKRGRTFPDTRAQKRDGEKWAVEDCGERKGGFENHLRPTRERGGAEGERLMERGSRMASQFRPLAHPLRRAQGSLPIAPD